jgi:hypothetical protein
MLTEPRVERAPARLLTAPAKSASAVTRPVRPSGYQRYSGCQAGVSLFAELTTLHVLCPVAGTLPMTHVMPVPSLFIMYMLPGPTLGSGAFVKTMLFWSGSQCGWM